MKKVILLSIALLAMQTPKTHAWSLSSSSSQTNSSEVSTATSTEGGTVNIGGKTYELEPGQTLEYSGGSKNISSSTVQEPGKEPVTTTVIEQQEPTVLINGEPANEAPESSDADLPSSVLATYQDGQLVSGTEDAAAAKEAFEKAELDAEIEAYLDFGDGYES